MRKDEPKGSLFGNTKHVATHCRDGMIFFLKDQLWECSGDQRRTWYPGYETRARTTARFVSYDADNQKEQKRLLDGKRENINALHLYYLCLYRRILRWSNCRPTINLQSVREARQLHGTSPQVAFLSPGGQRQQLVFTQEPIHRCV